jgi:hypothetical protein
MVPPPVAAERYMNFRELTMLPLGASGYRRGACAPSVRGGMARRKAQNPYGSCLAARRRLPARQHALKQRSDSASKNARQGATQAHALLRAFSGTGPCFRPVRRAANCADRSVSQLLAGTPSGPGGSSNAARVPRCDEARRRRTPSRLTTPHETPLNWTRWGHDTRGLGDGDYAGITHPLSSSRRKPGSRGITHRACRSGYRRSPV